jgi:predicted Mrr-cat superfamily restriction endonuclease
MNPKYEWAANHFKALQSEQAVRQRGEEITEEKVKAEYAKRLGKFNNVAPVEVVKPIKVSDDAPVAPISGEKEEAKTKKGKTK